MGLVLLTVVVAYLFSTFVTWQYILAQTIVMFILGNIVWRTLVKMKKSEEQAKFKEFWRTDTHLWSYYRFMFGAIFLFPVRLGLMIPTVCMYLGLVVISTAGIDFEKPLTGWRRFVFRMANMIFPRLALLAAGYFRIKTNRLQDFDYSKWLGKGYEKPKFYVSSVSNHSAWTDLFVMLIRTGGVSFVAKESIRSTPLFGRVGIALHTIFFSRVSSPEEKERIVDLIGDRQKALFDSKGEGVQLHIFAEGATTNNTHLIPFKRGVFTTWMPLLPVFIKYSSDFFNPAHDVMPMHIHFMVLLCQISNQVEVTELPIFAPNEYLFKNHANLGKEKWEIFANAVRQVMSEVSGLPTSEASIKDKFEWKAQIFGGKVKYD